jgi:ParB family chromosome partitioning protein
MATFQRKTGLGKGLSALLEDNETVNADKRSDDFVPTAKRADGVGNISIDSIETNPYQPRTDFDPIALNELADSIKVHGLIQPITVRQKGNTYELISGERRLRASKIAGLREVPAYIRIADNQQMLEMALIENIQRENLNAIEVALSFQQMIDECNLKAEELGDRVGKNRTTVANFLRLLKLPPVIQATIRDGKISMGHARALISVDNLEKQLSLHNEIISKGLSVRKVEELVRNLELPLETKSSKPENTSFEFQQLQRDLATKFSSKVKLKVKDSGKGAIEIPFANSDDLNRILALLDW